MKKIIARLAAVSVVFGSLVLTGPTPSSAEGNGVGSGGAPPPKCIMYTPYFAVYEDGYVLFADGSYAYVNL